MTDGILPGRGLRSPPMLLALLVIVVTTLSAVFGAGPTLLIAAVGFVAVLLAVLASRAVRRSYRQGPAWTENAETDREETNEIATELADLRTRHSRGDITDAAFERKTEQLLKSESESVIEAREHIEQLREEGKLDDKQLHEDQSDNGNENGREREREREDKK